MSKRYLAYYDVYQPVRIQVDGSRFGIGSAIIQYGKPDGHGSKLLTPISKYMQLVSKKCGQLYLLVSGFINKSMRRKCKLKLIINH